MTYVPQCSGCGSTAPGPRTSYPDRAPVCDHCLSILGVPTHPALDDHADIRAALKRISEPH